MLHRFFQPSTLSKCSLFGFMMPLMGLKGVWASLESRVRLELAGDQSDHAQYWFPAETAPHEATILGFPSQNSLPQQDVDMFRKEIVNIAHAIGELEEVRLYTRPEEVDIAQKMLDSHSHNNKNINIIPFPVVHAWVRDTAPNYVFQRNSDGACSAASRSGSQRFAVDFNFNEWGGKAPERGDDTPVLSKEELEDNRKFARRVIAADNDPSEVTRITTKVQLEGGGIELDGEGTLLITESAVVNSNRNPGMKKKDIYSRLGSLLGVTKIISIKGLRDQDITDCHIDGVVRFARPGVVVISKPHKNQGKRWVGVAEEAIKVLGNGTDAKGRPFELHVLDEPDPLSLPGSPDGDMSLSYANFYQANGGVIIPAFGNEKTDSAALALFQKLYPDRKISQIHIRAIALTGGGIHCVTQQVPKPMA